MKIKQFLFWILPTFILSFLASKLWLDPTFKEFLNISYWESIFRFGETLRIANTQYVDQNRSTNQKLTDKANTGMVTNLDKHSSYYKPVEYQLFRDDTHRRYVGIGVMIRKVDDGILITRVFDDGPAQEAGLSVGDFILKVEGNNVDDLDLGDVSSKIRGKEGTKVKIALRTEISDFREVSVERRKISISSVEGMNVDKDGVGYLHLVQFTANSGQECRGAITKLLELGMKTLVFDLRDNSGGLLQSAVEVLDIFLPKDQLVVSIKGRIQSEVRDYRCRNEAMIPDLPLLILMNEGSASASEIVAGTLSVLGRAKIVGENSFGKGSVQTIFPTDNKSGLRLTTAMYFLPDGSTIHEKGIIPDYLVECSDENETKLKIQKYSLDILDKADFRQKFGFVPIIDQQLSKAKSLLTKDDK